MLVSVIVGMRLNEVLARYKSHANEKVCERTLLLLDYVVNSFSNRFESMLLDASTRVERFQMERYI